MYQYNPNFTPRKVVIFGTGGTGSRVVPLAVQFVKSLAWVLDPEFILIDFDEVEPKNLKRQNFISPDVGRNKAVVLAERYGMAFEANVKAYTERFVYGSTSEQNLEMSRAFRNNSGHVDNVLFILCVDSVAARKEIVSHLMALISTSGTTGRYMIIDAGNEDAFGQIKLVGSGLQAHLARPLWDNREFLNQQVVEPLDIGSLPLDLEYFYHMEEGKSEGSCADLDQTMAINCLMAINIFTVIQNIYFARPIGWHRLDVSLDGSAVQHLIKRDYLLPFAQKILGGHSSPKAWNPNGICMSYASPFALQEDIQRNNIAMINEQAKGNKALKKELEVQAMKDKAAKVA